jgi:hypothetical protein
LILDPRRKEQASRIKHPGSSIQDPASSNQEPIMPDRLIRVGHSPDPDDAFMFYGLASGKVKIDGIRIEHVMEDIQSLNERAMRAELEVTAISAHAFVYIADRYWIMRTGASMGKATAHRRREEKLWPRRFARQGCRHAGRLPPRIFV